MAFGLLAPFILGAGALGQRAVLESSARRSEGRMRELLGQAPGEFQPDMFPGEAPIPGLKTAGSGLLADPGDQRRQLEAAAGIMGLSPRDRAAAIPLFTQIMGDASRANLSREGWTRSEGMQREQMGQADAQFQQRQSQIAEQFQQDHAMRREQFQENVRQFGVSSALEKLKFDDNRALAWARNAREEAEAAREAAKATNPYSTLKVPAGFEPAMVPGADGRMRPGVVPQRNTAPWITAETEQGSLNEARQLLAELHGQMGEPAGPDMFGGRAASMKAKHSQIVSKIAVLRNMGVLQGGELEQIEKGLPDPTGALTFSGTARDAYKEVDEQFRRALERNARKYAGWGVSAPGRTALDVERERAGGGSIMENLPQGSRPIRR